MCVDSRAINRKTIKDKYILQRIDDLLDSLKSSKYFPTLDLASNTDEQRVCAKDSICNSRWALRVLKDAFWACQCTSCFLARNKLYLRFDVAMSYIDDVLVTINKGMEYLKCVLKTFRAAGMTLRLNNCSFFTI